MNPTWIDRLARHMAGTGTTRRGVVRFGTGAALAGLALHPDDVAAACRKPKAPCSNATQCCTGKCKHGKCGRCPDGALFEGAPDPLCWLKWGSSGSGNGQFDKPFQLAVGGNAHVYVVDRFNHRIQEFGATGIFVRTWGTPGSGDGEFDIPSGVAVGGNDHVYVADTGNNRIQEFDATGGFVRTWGSSGSGNGQFFAPFGAAVGGNGHVYIADSANDRIQEFDPIFAPSDPGFFVRKWGIGGSGDGEFNNPYGVAAGGNGHIYVADSGNSRIQEFDATGSFVRKWGRSGGDGTSGSGNGQFDNPDGVAVGGNDHVYVADSGNSRVQEFDASGVFLRKWGGFRGGNGPFSNPYSVAVGGNDLMYIADHTANRIVRVQPL